MLDGFDEGRNSLDGLPFHVTKRASSDDSAVEIVFREIQRVDEQRYRAGILVANQGFEVFRLLGLLVKIDEGGQRDLGALNAHARKLVQRLLLVADVLQLIGPGHRIVGISGAGCGQYTGDCGQDG